MRKWRVLRRLAKQLQKPENISDKVNLNATGAIRVGYIALIAPVVFISLTKMAIDVPFAG
ncbi:hypothetical protein [Pontibacter toksunensis]